LEVDVVGLGCAAKQAVEDRWKPRRRHFGGRGARRAHLTVRLIRLVRSPAAEVIRRLTEISKTSITGSRSSARIGISWAGDHRQRGSREVYAIIAG
jgi:hypothetical protein